jgi:hypothetical protein
MNFVKGTIHPGWQSDVLTIDEHAPSGDCARMLYILAVVHRASEACDRRRSPVEFRKFQ